MKQLAVIEIEPESPMLCGDCVFRHKLSRPMLNANGRQGDADLVATHFCVVTRKYLAGGNRVRECLEMAEKAERMKAGKLLDGEFAT